jgi:hypothetical protein
MFRCHGQDGLIGRDQLFDGVGKGLKLLLYNFERIREGLNFESTTKSLEVLQLQVCQCIRPSRLNGC